MFDYIVAHRRLGEAEACKFFHQIVDGVESLHGFNITHRDLKPEVRVYLSPSNTPYFFLLYVYQLCSSAFNIQPSPCRALSFFLLFNEFNRSVFAQNLLLKAVPSGWVIKIADFGLSNTHEVSSSSQHRPPETWRHC